MTDTKGKEKTAKRGAGEKRLNRWERLMLNPESRKPNVMVLVTEEGNLIGMSLELYQRELAELKAQGGEAIQKVFNLGKRIRQKNPKMFRKRQEEAIGALVRWAVITGRCHDGGELTPAMQRAMLNCFYEEADEGIKRAKYQKAESVIITAAYKFARPFLISYRERRGIANTQSLSPRQGRAAWIEITAKPRWAKLVERHVRTSRKRRMEKNGLNIPIERMRKQSDRVLHNGINARWEREFPNKKGQK